MRLATLLFAVAVTIVPITTAHADLATLRRIDPSFVDELEGLSRRDVIASVTDRISPTTAIDRYFGDFDAYWRATASSRTGKFAEAQVALGYRRFAALHSHDYFINQQR